MFELNIEREFNTSASNLYKAWLLPDIMKTWFAPGDLTIPMVESDPKVGGQYKVVMEESDGSQHIVVGEFKELIEDKKIVMSWRWHESPNTTLVTILFSAIDDAKALLTLNHSEFIKEEYRDHHLGGWEGCLANLTKVR